MVDNNKLPSFNPSPTPSLGGHQTTLHQSPSKPPVANGGGLSTFLTELKLARENAILGNYEDALKKYKQSL